MAKALPPVLLAAVSLAVDLTLEVTSAVQAVLWSLTGTLTILFLLTWPPTARPFWAAVARQIQRELSPASPSQIVAGHAERENERRRAVLRAAHRIVAELEYAASVIEEHITSGSYWDPKERTLPTSAWSANQDILAEEHSTFQRALYASRVAYRHIDRVNHLVKRRWNYLSQSASIESERQDALDDALSMLRSAVGELNRASEAFSSRSVRP